jgi:sugar O-acyltransferase (sialic acid O-acetyltransferase NeuD family)
VSLAKEIYIFGFSGHSYVVLDSIIKCSDCCIGYFDKNSSSDNLIEIPFMGDERRLNLSEVVGDSYVFATVGDNFIRKNIIDLFEREKLKTTIIIDPSASISNFSSLGTSSYVGPMAVVNSFAEIGKGCIINTSAVVEHNCKIKDFVHIAPNATITGGVTIGHNTFIGANAIINPGVNVGNNVIIGSGTVVLNDVPDDTKWVGSPARKI